jgi:hypothetical protein
MARSGTRLTKDRASAGRNECDSAIDDIAKMELPAMPNGARIQRRDMLREFDDRGNSHSILEWMIYF